jgi:DNA-binding GntR family transcriptional regulator
MTTDLLSPAKNRTAASQVERQLREAIVQLALPPGTHLSEQELARRYGVSRQPVREALIALARSRLIEVRPNRGTVVVPISVQQMREARFVREAVEVAVVRRACQSFDPWQREVVDLNLGQQARVVADGDHDRFRTLDTEFHIAIARGAGCTMAWQAITDMKSHTDRACNLTLRYPHARNKLLDQHCAIIDAIDRHDADDAEATIREHLQSILVDLAALRTEHPELFTK